MKHFPSIPSSIFLATRNEPYFGKKYTPITLSLQWNISNTVSYLMEIFQGFKIYHIYSSLTLMIANFEHIIFFKFLNLICTVLLILSELRFCFPPIIPFFSCSCTYFCLVYSFSLSLFHLLVFFLVIWNAYSIYIFISVPYHTDSN